MSYVEALGFLALWLIVSTSIGFASGWQRLAARHRTRQEEPEHSQAMSGTLGGIGFRGAVRLAGTAEGLDMRVLFLFRAGHPPLLVPWSEVHEQADPLGTHVSIQLGERGPVLRIDSQEWAEITAYRRP